MLDAGLVANSHIINQERAVNQKVSLAQAGLASRSAKMNEAQAQKVATDFEVLFLSQMLSQMFGETLGDEFFGNKESSDVYKSLMVEEYSKKIVQSGGIGVADYVKRELLKLQEV